MVFLFFAGIVLVAVNSLTYDRPVQIQYRYLPRDLDNFIRTEPYPSAIFGSMWDASPRRGGDGGPTPSNVIKSGN
ncbi:hypothetical protein ATCVCanal1_280R [Acanthocystis turfacea Chlorella virus Canal-1]|nr:hypothetical protein ATCVCanal1_280R [Acanthocystis turfacea Chlorella virus Canal-1]